MGGNFQKFVLLMWKNIVLQYRHPIHTILEIIAPILTCSLLVVLRTLVAPEQREAMFYKPFEPQIGVLQNMTRINKILWSPFNPTLQDIVVSAIDGINEKQNVRITAQAVKNSQALLTHLNEDFQRVALAGIQFDDDLAGNYPLPHTIDITLRFPGELREIVDGKGEDSDEYSWKTNLLFPMYQVPGLRDFAFNNGAKPSYNSEGFLQIQKQLSLSIIQHLKNVHRNQEFNVTEVDVKMQRFCYPEWIFDKLLSTLRLFVSMLIMLSTVYACINNVRMITAEKEKQLKEAMKIMGLPNWLHWTAWFIKTFIVMFLGQIITVIILKFSWFGHGSIFPRTDAYVILCFLSLYASATTTFCFAITVFFSKANLAATVTGLLWFLSYFPYSFLQAQYDSLSLIEKLGACLCSTSAMGYGFQTILMFEGIGEGIHWKNIWKTTSPDDTLAFGLILIMLAFDTVLYFFITIYIEAVFPGEYGVAEVWYFPFTASYWCGQPKYVLLESSLLGGDSTNEFIESDPDGQEIGIRIIKLGKKYGHKQAVKNLTLNMYTNRITVLLGHNGAGKTTTMSMLTGLIRPTSGTALIGGHDIRTDLKGARNSLGLCPQYNILFEEMTVAEHLYFFSKLKGVKRKHIKAEIDKYIELLELDLKRNARAGRLSGGMQRKLSVGIALCGDSEIVMLDEPTAGMDPAARRSLWDLLISQKPGRTILLTTHFMDEADLLGDRIAIMAGGTLQCCGSSFFLKKKYGAGYHLIMEKSKYCNISRITDLLLRYIPTIQVKSDVGSELSYLLPEDHSHLFQKMLSNIENESLSLGIESYGISLTTLEEVFNVFGSDHGQEEVSVTLSDSPIQYVTPINYQTEFESSSNPKLLTGWRLWCNQVRAMLIKRLLTVIRAWPLFLVQNVLAILFISLAIVVVRNVKFYDDMPKLELGLQSYSDPITVMTSPSSTNEYANKLVNILEKNQNKIINWGNGNMTNRILEETLRNSVRVRLRYICGAEFHDSKIIAWFNNEAYHSPPLCLQLIMNSVLHKEVDDAFNIQFYNHPLRFTSETKFRDLARGHNMGYQIAFNLGFGMAFVSSFYVLFYIKERASKAKHIQFISGVGVVAFWGSSLLCDLITFMVTSLCICVAIVNFEEDGFDTFEQLVRLFYALTCFSFTMLPMTYLSSLYFEIPATGYTKMSLFGVLTGVVAFLGMHMLLTPGLNLQKLAHTLHWALLLLPHYCLSSAVRDMNILYVTHSICDAMVEKCIKVKSVTMEMCKDEICRKEDKCCTTTNYYYDWEEPGIGRNVVYSCAIGTILIVLLLLVEYRIINKIRWKLSRKRLVPHQDVNKGIQEDVDVKNENELIRNATFEEISQYNLFVRDMSKYYGKFIAVNKLCLAVSKYECFGLLGLNGAGKTTTFKMMTGDIKSSSGDAWVNGIPLRNNLKKIQGLIGYCPQFDALLDDLTCKETLRIFSLLRGLKTRDAKIKTEKLAVEFDFVKHLNKRVSTLSGGNKRKLSTAISVIGDPMILYLDEPTTGMDPATKRFLWDALCKIRGKGTCIVLTSHSMEECEALCTRLAIMVNGMFVCIGSPQHLKNRFSEGYTLMIKVQKGSPTDLIENYVSQRFPSATLREKHEELLTYYIPPHKKIHWSNMFGIMENAKSVLDIEDYSIGQCSLEQVFLAFTKYQQEKQKKTKKKISGT